LAASRARSATSGTQFLDPTVLGRIGNLQLLARIVVDGFLTGLHRSPHLGFSIDFAEHRAYMPGDDIRRIDWRLFARTDRHYIKLFEAEVRDHPFLFTTEGSGMDIGKVGDIEHVVNHSGGRTVPDLHRCIEPGEFRVSLYSQIRDWRFWLIWTKPDQAIALFGGQGGEVRLGRDRYSLTG